MVEIYNIFFIVIQIILHLILVLKILTINYNCLFLRNFTNIKSIKISKIITIRILIAHGSH